MPRASRAENKLIEILPIVLGHQAKSGQERPAKRIEAGVAVVWIRSEALQTEVTLFALASAGRIPAHWHIARFGCVPVACVPQCRTKKRVVS